MRVIRIEQNLGGVERAVRLFAGLALAAWILAQPQSSVLQWLGLVAAGFLVLNGVLGRCYLWHLLRLDSKNPCAGACDRNAGQRA